MHDLELKWMIPIHDEILLIIFRDAAVDALDAELVLNSDPRLMKSRNPAMQEEGFIVPSDTIPDFCQRIGMSKYNEPEDGVLVTVNLDTHEYQELLSRCEFYSQGHPNGITLQKLVLAFCRFLSAPENLNAIRAWTRTLGAFEPHRTITRQEAEADFRLLLDMVEQSHEPLFICNDGKPELVLFRWEDYWNRFSDLFPAGERERVEDLCRLDWEKRQESTT